jgi:hypothetical protein
VNRLPALRGITWLAQGFALMRAQPGRLLLLAVLLQLVLWLARVPLVGFFVILAMPALSAGLLQASACCAGRHPASTVLFAPWPRDRVATF